MRARLLGQSVFGPGLDGWTDAREILRGGKAWEQRPTEIGVPEILHARERRRASPVVRLALCVASEACAAARMEPTAAAGVFASAFGDGQVIDKILRSLASAEKLVSPTLFHNSVHNAAAGYWNIATASHRPATSIAAGDYSFAAGLLRALIQVGSEGCPVLLVQFDCPMPEPLNEVRLTGDAFAVAMVLGPDEAGGGPLLQASVGSMATPMPELPGGMASLLDVAPAGRALPLLRLVALGEPGSVAMEAAEGLNLHVTVTP